MRRWRGPGGAGRAGRGIGGGSVFVGLYVCSGEGGGGWWVDAGGCCVCVCVCIYVYLDDVGGGVTGAGEGPVPVVLLLDRLESYLLTNQIYAEGTDTDDVCTHATHHTILEARSMIFRVGYHWMSSRSR